MKPCPRCETTLLRPDRVYQASLTWRGLSCPSCRGLWLSRDLLDRLSREERNALVELRRIPPPDRQRAPLACVDCGHPMAKETSHRDPHVTVDVCPPCGKAWLDGGELEAIQTESLLASALQLVRWLLDPVKAQGLAPATASGQKRTPA